MEKATLTLDSEASPHLFPHRRLKADSEIPQTVSMPPAVIDSQYLEKETVLNKRGDGIDYLVSQKLIVRSTLTIEPGVVIAFEKNAGLEFRNKGTLKAKGTSEAPITFTGTEIDHGHWRGLFFNNDTSGNIMEYFQVLHGGGQSFDGLEVHANLRLKSGAEGGDISLSHCTFNESAGDGIYIGADNYNLHRFQNNTLRYNLRAPLSLEAGILGVLDGLHTICAYNGLNYVEVRGGRIFGKCHVKDAGIPYLFKEISMIGYGSSSATMTIDEGVDIKFASNAKLVVSGMGSLVLQGSKDDPVHLHANKKKTVPVNLHSVRAGRMINYYWYAHQPAVKVSAFSLGYVKKPTELSGSAEQMVVLGESEKQPAKAPGLPRLRQGRKYRLAG